MKPLHLFSTILLILIFNFGNHLIAQPTRVNKQHLVEADRQGKLLRQGRFNAYEEQLQRIANKKIETTKDLYIYNELANLYAKKLLKLETAQKYNQQLIQALKQPMPFTMVDGYQNLPFSISRAQGMPYIAEEVEYIKQFRNLTKNELIETASDRKNYIDMMLSDHLFKHFDMDRQKKVETKRTSDELFQCLSDTFAFKSKRLLAGYSLIKHWAHFNNWQKVLETYILVMTLSANSQHTYLDDYQLLKCNYFFYIALSKIPAHQENSLKALNQCITILDRIRKQYKDPELRAKFFRHQEVLADLKLAYYLEQKQIVASLVQLEDRKNRTFHEMQTRVKTIKKARKPRKKAKDSQKNAIFRSEPEDTTNNSEQTRLNFELPTSLEFHEDRYKTKGKSIKLEEDKIVLIYHLRESLLTLWILTYEQPLGYFQYKIPEKIIDKGLNHMYQTLYNDDQKKQAQNLMIDFHTLFTKAALDHLQKTEDLSKKKLLIVPFGELNNLPFHAFGSKKTPLFSYFKQITYIPSIKIYNQGKNNLLKAPYQVLGIAKREFETLPNLPYTKDEIEIISDHMKNYTLLHGHMAKKAQVLKQIKGANIVHIASHSVFKKDGPSRSEIYLHNDHQPNANLEAHELSKLNLEGKLFILSSCDSARQITYSGDDLFGFDRYLLRNGAASIISSLWKVKDGGTKTFFDYFYKHLANGHTPGQAWFQALGEAKKESQDDPRLWAMYKVTTYE